ncbi:hypothetical protein [Algiphilus aromaticivorans]|uniref:hypothetical protein n=1 Tax=Algiphilus aromaticivorans TaxID=382454 RepID=UPI0005C17D34|nr:hypothetical protein [Algiphilus aromaticivorans]
MANVQAAVQQIRDIADQIDRIVPHERDSSSRFVESEIRETAEYTRYVADCIATWDGRHIDEVGRQGTGVLDYNAMKFDIAQFKFGFPVTDIADALISEMEAEADAADASNGDR